MTSNITIEGAKIRFRNFAGKEDRFNPAGKRSFCVFIDPDLAETLHEDGWNVKYLQPREEGEEPQAYLQVAVSYAVREPKIVLVTSKKKMPISEDMVHMLDYAEIANVDLIITPYKWEMGSKSGIKAYLKSMYVTVVEDELDEKYADIPESEDEIPFD